jgi:hypothetical protein
MITGLEFITYIVLSIINGFILGYAIGVKCVQIREKKEKRTIEEILRRAGIHESRVN